MIVTWEDVLRQQKTVRNCALVAGVLAFIGLVINFAGKKIIEEKI